MELKVRIDSDAKLRIQTLSGDATPDALFAAVKEVYRHPEFNVEHNFLWDFRNCNMEEVSSEMVRQFATFINSQWSDRGTPPKGAVVVSRDLEFGLSRLFTTHLAEGSNFRVYRDLEEAMEWLGEGTSP